jgi:hypothetical protein
MCLKIQRLWLACLARQRYIQIAVARQQFGCLNNQHPLDASMFAFVDDNAAVKVALGFFRLCAKDVAHSGAIAFDFPRAGYLETLLGAGVGFHFRHGKNVFF